MLFSGPGDRRADCPLEVFKRRLSSNGEFLLVDHLLKVLFDLQDGGEPEAFERGPNGDGVDLPFRTFPERGYPNRVQVHHGLRVQSATLHMINEGGEGG